MYVCMCAEHVEWYMNCTRLRHSARFRTRLSLLASGMTSNEALHANLRKWLDGIPTMYPSTLALKLNIASLSMLWSHSTALSRPTTAQMSARTLIVRSVSAHKLFSEAEWEQWLDDECTVQLGRVELTRTRHKDRAMLNKWVSE